MGAVQNTLLLKFRAKDTLFGVTRDTVKALAAQLDTTETQVVHMALSRLADDLLPAYAQDTGPLTAAELTSLRRMAKKSLPTGRVLDIKQLF